MHNSVFLWGRFKSTLLFSLSNTRGSYISDEGRGVRCGSSAHIPIIWCVWAFQALVCQNRCVRLIKAVRSTGDKARNTSPWLWCFSWHHLKAVFVPCSRWKNQSLTATIQVRQQPKRNQDCSLQGRRCLFSCLLQKSNAEGVFAAEFYR